MRGPVARSGALGILAVFLLLRPLEAEAGNGRPWYVPDHAKFQLAGNIGFLSPGLGYSLGRRVETDVLFGWVPEAIGGEDLFMLTGKVTWAPWRLGLPRRWLVRPFTAALQLTYHFGQEYWVLLPDRYPAGYYQVPTALRAGIGFGSMATRTLWGRNVGLYYEFVALDAGLWLWISNRKALSPLDVFSLAVGARIDF